MLISCKSGAGAARVPVCPGLSGSSQGLSPGHTSAESGGGWTLEGDS